MTTYYYQARATLHICNQCLYCSSNDYERLEKKGKITKLRQQILIKIKEYRLLTEEMISWLIFPDCMELHKELDALSEYGLIVKQFYEYENAGETKKTCTFYSISAHFPGKWENKNLKVNHFCWDINLKIENAMSILAFNAFHLSLLHAVPKKYLQTQTIRKIEETTINGYYLLKSPLFYMGYSHCIALSVRDFAVHNNQVPETIKFLTQHYMQKNLKIPWFVLLCENERQCAYINRNLVSDQKTCLPNVFYILDTDFEYGENPLQILQKYRFGKDEKEILCETCQIMKWYENPDFY